MKIRNVFFCLVIILIQSCGLFKGGNNCDCPKFGYLQNSDAIMLAHAADVAVNNSM